MVKPESGNVVQQWAVKMEAARNLLDSASTRVEGVLDNDERKSQAPPIVRLLLEQTKEWEKDEAPGKRENRLKKENLLSSLQFLHDTGALHEKGEDLLEENKKNYRELHELIVGRLESMLSILHGLNDYANDAVRDYMRTRDSRTRVHKTRTRVLGQDPRPGSCVKWTHGST